MYDTKRTQRLPMKTCAFQKNLLNHKPLTIQKLFLFPITIISSERASLRDRQNYRQKALAVRPHCIIYRMLRYANLRQS